MSPRLCDPERLRCRRPPAVQSMSRLQRTVGNRAAQRLLGVGDGRVAEADGRPANWLGSLRAWLSAKWSRPGRGRLSSS
jgi:hypothetical protein